MALNILKLTGSCGDYKRHFTFISVFLQRVECIHVSLVSNVRLRITDLRLNSDSSTFYLCDLGKSLIQSLKAHIDYMQVWMLYEPSIKDGILFRSYLEVNRLILKPTFLPFFL